MTRERTALELADEALAAPDPGYGTRLAAIRAPASADGVSLTVDLHGALVDLRFERRALESTPAELAALVRRLATEAAAQALRLGREVLGDLLPEDAAAEIGEPVAAVEPTAGLAAGPVVRRSRRPAPEPEEESFTPATWAT